MSATNEFERGAESLSEEHRDLLAWRAEQVRQAQASLENDVDVLHVCEFPIGRTTYAFPLSVVRAAAPLRGVTPVLLSEPHVIGVMRFQGRVVSVLSLSTMVGIRGWQADPTIVIVIQRQEGGFTAFDCEQIPKPATLSMAAVKAARPDASGAILEVATTDLNTVHLIDVEALIRATRREGSHGV